MARSFLTPVNLNKNELQNAVVQNLASAPSSPVKGQLYFNSTGGDNTLYWYDGTTWVPAKDGGGAGFPGYGSVVTETAYGLTSTSGVSATVSRSDHTHGSPVHDNAAHNLITLSALGVPISALSMASQKITGLADPSAATDAANKQYVDNLVAGLSWKDPVRCASAANVSQTGAPSVDGVFPNPGDRVLCKNQTTTSQNGIWVAAAGAWTRATDADAVGELEGAAVMVLEGSTNFGTGWTCTTVGVITPGTTATVWVQFFGGASVTAGAGMTQSGNTLNVIAGDTTLTVAADDVRVNTSVIATVASLATYTRKFTQATIGGATSQVVTHNLGTQAVLVDVYRTLTPWDTVDCDIERTTSNTVTLRFAVAPATNEYSVVVVG